jgi:undecaprenyl-diphosphatase
MMSQFDIALTRGINGLAGGWPLLDQLMIYSSSIGVPILVLAVAAQWWLTADRRHTRHVVVAAGLSFLAGLALNQFVLLFIHRERPYDAGITHLLIGRSADFSFPSDHATAVVAIAATFLLHRMSRRGLVFLAAAIVVGFSRIYVGIHYASDVLGGAATGTVAALAIAFAYREGTKLDGVVTSLL